MQAPSPKLRKTP